MTYKINGTALDLQPTTGRWVERKPLGIDGFGHPIYPGVREFELTFILGSPAEYNQFQSFYNAISNTGTAVVDLPRYGYSTYTFFSYSGCIVREPVAGEYFTENQTKITLLITNIRT